jgi:Tol biopolymer transport system component
MYYRMRTRAAMAALLTIGGCHDAVAPIERGDPSELNAPPDPTQPLPKASVLAFSSDRDGNHEIYAMNVDGSGQINLTNNPAAADYVPSWSPNGKKIAFLRSVDKGPDPNDPAQEIFNEELMVMNSDGTGVVDVSGSIGLVPNQVVSWSPDASTIAFTVIGPPPASAIDIWLAHPDGSGLVPLTSDGLFNAGAVWSPDGSKIAFVRNQSDGVSRTEDRGIYMIVPNRSGAIQLTANSSDQSPTWSPSGAQIAFTRKAASGWEIYVMSATGTGQTNLTNQAGDDVDPAWSPDGGTIAFSSARTGEYQIFRMAANGGSVLQLTSVGHNAVPLWAPGGGIITFTRRPSNSTDFDIWRMSGSGGGQVQLTTVGNNTTPTWRGAK